MGELESGSKDYAGLELPHLVLLELCNTASRMLEIAVASRMLEKSLGGLQKLNWEPFIRLEVRLVRIALVNEGKKQEENIRLLSDMRLKTSCAY